MNDSHNRRWLAEAIFLGLIYCGVGMASSALAGAAASGSMRSFWRLFAFGASGIVFAAHIGHEHFRFNSSARTTAWHVAVGVAIGGFALALAANVHDLGSAAGYRPRMLIALVAWPLLTAVPAYVVAWVVAAALGMRRRGDEPS